MWGAAGNTAILQVNATFSNHFCIYVCIIYIEVFIYRYYIFYLHILAFKSSVLKSFWRFTDVDHEVEVRMISIAIVVFIILFIIIRIFIITTSSLSIVDIAIKTNIVITSASLSFTYSNRQEDRQYCQKYCSTECHSYSSRDNSCHFQCSHHESASLWSIFFILVITTSVFAILDYNGHWNCDTGFGRIRLLMMTMLLALRLWLLRKTGCVCWFMDLLTMATLSRGQTSWPWPAQSWRVGKKWYGLYNANSSGIQKPSTIIQIHPT